MHRRRGIAVIAEQILYWVKEWTKPDAPHLVGTLRNEYDRLLDARDVRYEADGVTVRAVGAHGFEDNRILMEYLEHHQSIKSASVSRNASSRVINATRNWVAMAGLTDSYDLHANNIMVGLGLEVVLVDFESSYGRDRLGEDGL